MFVFFLTEILPVDIETINVYKELCLDVIFNTVKEEKVKDSIGYITISVADETIKLELAFYNDQVISIEAIKRFLNILDWNTLIRTYAFDVPAVFNQVLDNYAEYITKEISQRISGLIQDHNFQNNARNKILEMLPYIIQTLNLDIPDELKKLVYSKEYLENILLKMDFTVYTLTREFQSNHPFTLIALYYQETLILLKEFENQSIIEDRTFQVIKDVLLTLPSIYFIKFNLPIFLALFFKKAVLIAIIRSYLLSRGLDLSNFPDTFILEILKLILKNEPNPWLVLIT